MKALGITAMIFAIIAIFIPFVGPLLTLLIAAIAAFAAGPGLTYGCVALGVNIINLIFLSPTLWTVAAIATPEDSAIFAPFGVMFLVAQGLALIILWRLNKRYEAKALKAL